MQPQILLNIAYAGALVICFPSRSPPAVSPSVAVFATVVGTLIDRTACWTWAATYSSITLSFTPASLAFGPSRQRRSWNDNRLSPSCRHSFAATRQSAKLHIVVIPVP